MRCVNRPLGKQLVGSYLSLQRFMIFSPLYFFLCRRSLQSDVAVARMSTRSSHSDSVPQRTIGKSVPSEAVPPLPPRQSNKRASVRSNVSAVSGVVPVVPPRPINGHQRSSSDDTDSVPTRPPKRRKISQSSPSSNQTSSISKVRHICAYCNVNEFSLRHRNSFHYCECTLY